MHNIGRIGWPQPPGIVLIDRTTSTQYLIGHNSAGTDLSLITPVPSLWNGVPKDYHILPSAIGDLRVYVDNGFLRYELATSDEIQDGPLYTLNYAARRATCHITADSVSVFGDPLTLVCFTVGNVTPDPSETVGSIYMNYVYVGDVYAAEVYE